MEKTYPADTVVADGTVYPTVEENIRSISATSLKVNGAAYRLALYRLLTGIDGNFGGTHMDAYSKASLAVIYNTLKNAADSVAGE